MNNKLQLYGDRHKIEAALERVRLEEMKKPKPGDRFDLPCWCAVHDKPYILRFIRQPSMLLRFSASIKVLPSGTNKTDGQDTGADGISLSMDEFENSSSMSGVGSEDTPCAWCGDGSFHHCRLHCGAFVCGGRMQGDLFRCRKSCGAEWVGVPLLTVNGSSDRQDRQRIAAPARSTIAAAHNTLSPPAGKEPLRLSVGSNSRKDLA